MHVARTLTAWMRDGLAAYRDRRLVAILAMGFASGLPLALVGGTLSRWLSEAQVSRTDIGLFALVQLPYTVKFLWSPAIDLAPLPWLTRALGRRRGWALALQAALAAAILWLGTADPAVNAEVTAAAALVVAFLSASQDIVIDAYRIELLDAPAPADLQGAGAAATQWGYRFGLIAGGAGALAAAESGGWFFAYAVMAALMMVGMAAVLATREPAAPAVGPLDGHLQRAVVEPFAEFTTRPSWLLILLFVVLYKFGDALAGHMTSTFYTDLGFTKIEVASVSKLFGVVASMAGVALGGVLVFRIGTLRSLLACGVLQALSNLAYVLQARAGHDVGMLTLTIGIENVMGGMGSAAFVAYLSGLCGAGYTATQYALLSSLSAVARTVLSSGGGWLADRLDWVGFFLAATAAATPGLLCLLILMRRQRAPLAVPAA